MKKKEDPKKKEDLPSLRNLFGIRKYLKDICSLFGDNLLSIASHRDQDNGNFQIRTLSLPLEIRLLQNLPDFIPNFFRSKEPEEPSTPAQETYMPQNGENLYHPSPVTDYVSEAYQNPAIGNSETKDSEVLNANGDFVFQGKTSVKKQKYAIDHEIKMIYKNSEQEYMKFKKENSEPYNPVKKPDEKDDYSLAA